MNLSAGARLTTHHPRQSRTKGLAATAPVDCTRVVVGSWCGTLGSPGTYSTKRIAVVSAMESERCSETGKVRFSNRTAAKRAADRTWGRDHYSIYRCHSCGAFHNGTNSYFKSPVVPKPRPPIELETE